MLPYLLFWLAHLCQGREAVKIFGNISIINCTVVPCHFQGGVPQQLLEHKCVPSAIHQVFAGEGVSIEVRAGFLYTTGMVVMCHRQPQSVHREHPAVLVTEQIIFRLATSDGHILPQKGHHHRAQGDSLDFAIFVVAKQNLPCVQIHIPVLDIADSSRAASAVHQEINNDPVSIVAEGAVLLRPFQQSQRKRKTSPRLA